MHQAPDHTELSASHALVEAHGAAHEAAHESTRACLVYALRGEPSSAVELLDRLLVPDASLWEVIDDPASSVGGQVRVALLRYLALGTWQGQTLPLPAAHRLSHERCTLWTQIGVAACEGATPGWRMTLLGALQDGDARLRRAAITLLGTCDHPDALMVAVNVLADVDEGVRWAAALALARHDGATVEALLRRLTMAELVPEMRHTAAYVLRNIPDLAARQQVASVVEALDGSFYRAAAPLAAGAALHALHASGVGGMNATTRRVS